MSDSPAAKRSPPPIPVTLLTGFLGAGKTTLLNRLLGDPALADTAVLINEFGEVGLDHLLVREVGEGVTMLQSGCVCCTLRGDLVGALEELLRARDNGRVTPFARLVIETTGLADPIPILHTLIAHRYFAMRFRLDAVVTVIDAINGLATLDEFPEAARQAAVADRAVISKSDLLDTTERRATYGALLARLDRLAPTARRLDAAAGEATADRILAAGLFDPATKTQDVTRWLNDVSLLTDGPHDAHEDGIKSFVLTSDRLMGAAAFDMFLDLLRGAHGPKLLRVKGLVGIAEFPDKPVLIHGARQLFHSVEVLDAWPDGERRTRIVFVLKDMEPNVIQALHQAFVGNPVPNDARR